MENKKSYYIFLDDKKIDVSEKVYKEYWKETNRERYLYRLDKENHLRFFSELENEDSRSVEERLADSNVDVEKIFDVKFQIEELHKALDRLSPEEREIIQALFFDEKTQEEVAEKLGINQRTVGRKRNKILKKLKVILDDLV